MSCRRLSVNGTIIPYTTASPHTISIGLIPDALSLSTATALTTANAARAHNVSAMVFDEGGAAMISPNTAGKRTSEDRLAAIVMLCLTRVVMTDIIADRRRSARRRGIKVVPW